MTDLAQQSAPAARQTGERDGLLDAGLLLALATAATLLLFWNLGQASLADWDEAIYAQIAKEIVDSGRWLTLHWEYQPWFEKPPLLIWTTTVFFKLFGVTPFWARAASALSGVGVVALTYLIARRTHGRLTAVLSGIVLLTSYQFIASARFGTMDVMLTLCLMLAVYGYLRLEDGGERWWYLIGLALGLAIMVKSAAAIVVPAALGAALLLDQERAQTVRSAHFWGGLGVALLVAAPWHLAMLVGHGERFANVYIGLNILERSATALEQHEADRYFYVWSLQYRHFPWFYLTPFALVFSLRESLARRSPGRILLAVVLTTFGLYTVVQTKLDWYIVPLYPALAILIAALLARASRSLTSAAFSSGLIAAGAVSLVAPVWLVAGLVALAGLAALWIRLARWRSQRPAALLTAVVLLFFVAVGARELRPLYEMGVAPEARLTRLANDGSRDPLIVASGLWRPTPLFYSDRPILVAYDLPEVTGFVAGGADEIILARSDIAQFPAFEFDIRAEAGPLVYATVRTR